MTKCPIYASLRGRISTFTTICSDLFCEYKITNRKEKERRMKKVTTQEPVAAESEGASDLFQVLEGSGGPKVKQLVRDTDNAIASITESAGISLKDSTSQAAQKLATWAERMTADAGNRELKLEELRQRVATELASVDNDQAIAAQKSFAEDLRKAVFGLTAEQQQFEQFLGMLDGECTEADAEVKNANQRVEDARNLVPRAEAAIQIAEQKSVFLGIDWGGKKKTAIAAAKAAAEEARAELEAAKADIEPAKLRAEEIRRERLMNAQPDALLNLILSKGSKVYEAGMNRAKILKEEEATATAERIQVVKDREIAQRTLDKINQELAVKEREVTVLSEEIERTANPSDRAKLETQLSTKKAELQVVANNRNKTFLYSQSKQRMAELLEQTEEAARSLRASIEGMCLMLKSDLETRETVYRAGVEALKAAADMKVLSSADQTGARTDQRVLETMSQTALAAERTIAEVMKQHPDRLAAMRHVRKVMAQNRAVVDDEMQKQLEAFYANYGMNPSDGNSIHFREVPTDATAPVK